MRSMERGNVVSAGRSTPIPILAVVGLGLVACVVARVCVIGSDALWLSALGDTIRAGHEIPTGVPFAAAPSEQWVNTTVLGQILFSLLHLGGSVGIVAAQVATATCSLWLLVGAARRRGASGMGLAIMLGLVLIGGAAPLLIARAQLLSLVPYAALLVLVRREHERPSRMIWAAVPLVALWGNLHGAVLVGVAVLGCYLLFSRLPLEPWTAVAVGLASAAATCLNPGLLRAPRYYLGVFSGAATSDDSGMWSRPTISNPLDVLLIAASVVLAYIAFRHRRPLWEYAATLGLAGASALAGRHGIWLVLFLAVPAAVGLASPSRRVLPPPGRSRVLPAATAAACILVVAGLLTMRAPVFHLNDMTAAQLVQATRGEVVLVAEPLAESMAAAGATVWVSNPLDAFDHADQAAYLAFMDGDATAGARAFRQADVVVAVADSPPARAARASGYTVREALGPYVLLRRG